MPCTCPVRPQTAGVALPLNLPRPATHLLLAQLPLWRFSGKLNRTQLTPEKEFVHRRNCHCLDLYNEGVPKMDRRM